MPREFTSQKAIRNHAELTGYVYLWEGTHAFTTRRLLLSPDQYEIVDVRTDRGMRRAMLFPKSNPKSRVGRRRAVARRADNQARAMAAIAVGEREEWTAPQRVKPVHSGVLSGPERGSSKSRGRLVRLSARRKRFVALTLLN